MPRIILALALLMLVGGCGEKQEEHRADLQEMTIRLTPIDKVVNAIPDPCPPCQPETVYRYASPSVTYQMPPGRWVSMRRICNWCEVRGQLQGEPDSVFILSDDPGQAVRPSGREE